MPPKERWIGRPHRRSPIIPNFTYLGTISGHAPFELVSAPTTDPSSFASGTLPLHPQRGSALRDFSGSLPGPRGSFASGSAALRVRNCFSERRYAANYAPAGEVVKAKNGLVLKVERVKGWPAGWLSLSHRRLSPRAGPSLPLPVLERQGGMFIHHCASANAVPILMRT